MSVPICSCCNTNKAKVLMKFGRSADDWLIASCDICLEEVCKDCYDNDEAGRIICTDCYATENLRKKS